MAWLAPVWLLAAAAVVLPLVLHLWSRGQARRVQVGSVGWLRPAEGLRGRRFRPSDPVLLAVRVGFWLLLAAALALPRWSRDRGAEADAGVWALVLPSTPSGERLDQTIGASGRRVGRRLQLSGSAPLWSWLVETDRRAPSGVSFLVVGPLEAAQLGGERPRLGRPVEFIEFVASESAPVPPVSRPRPQRPLPVAWIGDWPSRNEERSYARAALHAAADALGTTLEEREERDEIDRALALRIADTTLVFAEPPAATTPCRVPQLLRAGGVEHLFDRLLCEDGPAASYSVLDTRGRDAFGRPWLSIGAATQGEGEGELWRLELPLTLSTSDLPASPAWPALVADLATAAARRSGVLAPPPADTRGVGVSQAAPSVAPASAVPRPAAWPEALAWLGVAALAGAERWLSARRVVA